MEDAAIIVGCVASYFVAAVGLYRHTQAAYPLIAHDNRWADAAFSAFLALFIWPFAGPVLLLMLVVRGLSLGIDAIVRRWSVSP